MLSSSSVDDSNTSAKLPEMIARPAASAGAMERVGPDSRPL
jgi:hypothetical protein